jgi:hypothetical protein
MKWVTQLLAKLSYDAVFAAKATYTFQAKWVCLRVKRIALHSYFALQLHVCVLRWGQRKVRTMGSRVYWQHSAKTTHAGGLHI